jgi:hypothetical protein
MDSLWSVLLNFSGEFPLFPRSAGSVLPGVWYIECHTPSPMQMIFSLFHDAEPDQASYPKEKVENETVMTREIRS